MEDEEERKGRDIYYFVACFCFDQHCYPKSLFTFEVWGFGCVSFQMLFGKSGSDLYVAEVNYQQDSNWKKIYWNNVMRMDRLV